MSKQLEDTPFETVEQRRAALEKAYSLGVTEYFEFFNQSTKYDVKIALAQGLDEDGVESGMAENTGVVTIARELGPGKSKKVDISRLNCRATRAKCSIIWRWRETGYEESMDMKDKVAPSGGYLPHGRWAIGDPESFDAQAETPPAPIID